MISSLLSCYSSLGAVPAYGLWGLSKDEGGVSGVAHTRFGEGYWMVHFGLLPPNSWGAGLAVWGARWQALVQSRVTGENTDIGFLASVNSRQDAMLALATKPSF